MNRSRTRQFGQIRNHSSSVHSQTRSIRSSKLSQSTVSEACVNCVNLIMAQRHKKADKQQKQKGRAQFRKNYQMMSSWVDPQHIMRQSMKKDALNYNSKLIQQQKNAKIHEKQQQINSSINLQKNIEQAQLMVKQQLQEQKQKKDEYYHEIQQQYLTQLQKKDKMKLPKQNTEPSGGLPLYNPDTTKQKLQYKRDLQRQMEQKKQREQRQRINSQKRQKELLNQYNAEAQKYHADNYESMTMSKQEVFGGLKSLQISRKRKAEEVRKMNDNERMQLIKQQNEERSRAVKLKMKEMQNYVQGLKQQLLQKQERLRTSKRQNQNFTQKVAKSTQQIHAQMQIKKTCKGCHKDYPQQFIGPVPKKI